MLITNLSKEETNKWWQIRTKSQWYLENH